MKKTTCCHVPPVFGEAMRVYADQFVVLHACTATYLHPNTHHPQIRSHSLSRARHVRARTQQQRTVMVYK